MTRPVPHGWKLAQLDTLIETLESGSRPKGGASTETGDIPSLGGENILQDGGIRFSPVRLVSSEFHGHMGKGLLKDNDVLINKDGANTGKVGFYHNSPYEQACINEHVFLIRGYKSKLNQGFLYYTLLSPQGSKQVSSKITGSAQPGLGTGFIRNYPILLPPLPEQEGIAAVLGSVDATIDATKQVIAQTRQLKRALMQALLTRGLPGQHTQFKPSPLGTIPADWEVVKLGKVCEKITDGTHQGVKVNETGEIPFVYVSCIKNGVLDFSNSKFIDKKTYDQIMKGKETKKGIVLYTVKGSYGRSAVVRNDLPFAFQRDVAYIKPNVKLINADYLNTYFESDYGKLQSDSVASGQAQKAVTLKQLNNFNIPLPPLPEQEAIVGILNTVDARLAQEGESTARLQTLKIALMQVLLTGEVRVPVALGVSRPAEHSEVAPIAVREFARQGSRQKRGTALQKIL